METVVQRLNDWWPFPDPISFKLKKNIILIVLTEDLIECIGIILKLKVTLFGTIYNSIIRAHIIRVFAASIPPVDLRIEELYDPPRAYKSDPVDRASTLIALHE